MVPVSASNVNTNLFKGQQNLTSNHWAFKNPLWVGAGTEMRTQYLPANDIASASSGPISASYVKTVIYLKVSRILPLTTGPLITCSGLEPVPRCEPSTYQPITQ